MATEQKQDIHQKYEHFCQDAKCAYYNFLHRLESKPFEFMSDAERSQLESAKSRCRERCSKTAYQLYHWLKRRRLTDLTSQLD